MGCATLRAMGSGAHRRLRFGGLNQGSAARHHLGRAKERRIVSRYRCFVLLVWSFETCPCARTRTGKMGLWWDGSGGLAAIGGGVGRALLEWPQRGPHHSNQP